MKLLLTFILNLIIFAPLKAQDQQAAPFTLADRDRIIRTEIKVESLESKVDTKIEALNSRIDYIFWSISVMFTLMLFMFGYMIWDRHTALKPALGKAEASKSLSSTNTKVLRITQRNTPDWLRF